MLFEFLLINGSKGLFGSSNIHRGVDALFGFVLAAVAKIVVFLAGPDEGIVLAVLLHRFACNGFEVVSFGLRFAVFVLAGEISLFGELVGFLEAGNRSFDAAVS